MKLQTHFSHSPEETKGVARALSEKIRSGDALALLGDLGAGKTCFAKGLISALSGLPEDQITSPTFTLVEEYEGTPRIHHVDLYRLESPQELEDLPLDELFDGKSITLIEWAEKAPSLIKHCQWEIKIVKQMEQERVIEISKKGNS